MKNWYLKLKNQNQIGSNLLNNEVILNAQLKSDLEMNKKHKRTDVLNEIIKSLNKESVTYLEIGVRNPNHNFNKIIAKHKYSVDPGIEFKENPVDFKLTSDDFFEGIREGKILDKNIRFDVIFIDGLHTSEQVEKDVINSLEYIDDNGFIVLHDCNPPTEIHAREDYNTKFHPVMDFWNGTTWKVFFKYRQNKDYYTCCVDTDWGIGVICKKKNIGLYTKLQNHFYEYSVFDKNRVESLNLISFEDFQRLIK